MPYTLYVPSYSPGLQPSSTLLHKTYKCTEFYSLIGVREGICIHQESQFVSSKYLKPKKYLISWKQTLTHTLITAGKKSESKWKKHFFMFLSSEWICVWRVPKTQTHSAYMCALPPPHKWLFPYALHTEYICASFTTPQGTGTRWMIYATYLPTSLWHNLFLSSSSL